MTEEEIFLKGNIIKVAFFNGSSLHLQSEEEDFNELLSKALFIYKRMLKEKPKNKTSPLVG